MKKIFWVLLCLSSFQLFSQRVIDLSEWDGNLNIEGRNAFDSFGSTVTQGDINGDGFADIIVGAPFSDPLGRNSAGSVYLFWGSANNIQNAQLDLSIESADLEIFGSATNDQLGKAITVGNINNDAYADIIISAPFANFASEEAVGKVYVIFGSSNLPSSIDLLGGNYNRLYIGASVNDNLGISLISTDLNGDNFDDLVLGSPNGDFQSQINCGKAYLFYGNSSMLDEVDLATSNADATFIGENLNDNLSAGMAVGNINGDLYNDLALGAPGFDSSGRNNSGKIYLLKGRSNLFQNEIYLESSNLIESTIIGSAPSSFIGRKIQFSNFNGDNFADLFITDFAANNFLGRVEAIFGNVTLPLEIDFAFGASNLSIFGGNESGVLGEYLTAGFINSDSFEDIIIGSPQTSNSQGQVLALFGAPVPETVYNLNTYTPDILIIGETAEAETGRSLSSLDYNNDSRAEIVIGSPLGSSNAGSATMIYADLPYVNNQVPASEQNNVEITTDLSFHIYDDMDGIDLNTISVNIAGTVYNSSSPNLSFSGNQSNYFINILPDTPFGYNQQVDVSINAEDFAGWQLPELSYRFFTREDTDPPFTDNWIPAPDSLGVPVTTDITFDIFDYGEGVDISSVVVQVQTENYYNGTSGFFYSGDSNNYQIVVNPPEDFYFGETVQVTISASDLAEVPNAMSPFSYSFVCGVDLIPPLVLSWDPEEAESVGINSPLIVEVVDWETGIDETSLQFYVDNLPILTQSTITPSSQGSGVTISYFPAPGNYFTIGEHTIRIVASDNAVAPNSIDTTSVFICIADNQPPITDNHFPEKFEDEAATNTSFQVDILDLLTGVDEISISISLNDNEIIGDSNTTITEIADGFRVTYNPPERLQGQVEVLISAADQNEPANTMPIESYWFICTPDTDSPFNLNANPQVEEENVSRSSNIYLELHDAKTGVDLNSIQLWVNGENVTSTISINPVSSGYSLFYTHTELWDFDTDINVQVTCQDLAIIPNGFNLAYTFHTISDLDPPYLVNMSPEENEVGVMLDSDITFSIRDDGLGVNLESIRMFVNNLQIEPVITSTIDIFEYSVSYDAPLDFNYGDEVEVAVFANDLAFPANGLNNYVYSFSCVDDDEVPPVIRGYNPTPNAIDVPINSSVSFEIIDAESGVSENSIIFKINNDFILNYDLEAVSYGDSTGFRLQYVPTPLFNYGETIYVQIYASDNSSNFNDVLENYSFQCETDLEAPLLVKANPEPFSSGYPNTTFFFEFSDEESGLNLNSFVFKLNETLITNYVTEEGDHSLVVTYEPVTPLTAGEQLEVSLNILDLLGNELDSTYTVNIEPDEFPPYLNPVTPEANSFSAKLGDQVILDVLDKGMGIDPASIDFSINGETIDNYDLIENPYSFNPDSLGYQIHFVLDEERHYEGQLVQIEVSAQDIANPNNEMNEAYYFHIFKEIKNQSVKAIPPIITLNNDGYNDICRIWIKTNDSISKLSGKIFSRQKSEIAQLSIKQYDAESYFADWDGKTKNGKYVAGGLYLYQIKLDGKSYQGTITVAR